MRPSRSFERPVNGGRAMYSSDICGSYAQLACRGDSLSVTTHCDTNTER